MLFDVICIFSPGGTLKMNKMKVKNPKNDNPNNPFSEILNYKDWIDLSAKWITVAKNVNYEKYG